VPHFQVVPRYRHNHFFDGKVEPLLTHIGGYLDRRLKTERKPVA
jgi:hypothetical protein